MRKLHFPRGIAISFIPMSKNKGLRMAILVTSRMRHLCLDTLVGLIILGTGT